VRKRRQLNKALRTRWAERILILKILRAARGWTRLQLAKAAGLTLLRIAVHERGNLAEMGLDELVEALGFRAGAVAVTKRFLAQLDKDRS
jgi:transcriptional regulator with XRE-family HTH domain